jgi:alpha-N-arabinofuranosidase
MSRCLLFILVLCCCATMARAQLVVTQPIPQTATITVDTRHPDAKEIPPTIFGTFLEPIGNSTYNGLWAELLQNPSFEAGLWSATNVRSMIEKQPELERASELGLPLPWEPLDPHQGNRYELRYGDAANSEVSLEIIGVPGRPTGIKQKVFLPARGVLEFHGSLYAKHLGGPATLDISLRSRNHPEQILAHASVDVDSTGWKKYPFTFKLTAPVAPLVPSDFVIQVKEDESVLLDQVSLMPADAIDGLDPQIVAMVRAMHTGLIRFGGNFTSGYHWRDGVGPRDKRVSMLNVAWGIPEYNTFGTDEFLHFCELVNAEPQIALNLGSGSPEEAAQWVQYVNQHWKNGSGGLLWELGNELWGSWNTGWPTLEQLAARTAGYSRAIRAVDPKARLIATGQDPDVYQKWNAAQLSNPPGTMDFLSSHFVVTTDALELKDATPDFRTAAGLALPLGLERRFKDMQAQIDRTAHRGKVHIAFTEWLWVSSEESAAKHAAPTPHYDNFAGALTTGGMFNSLLRSTERVPISDMTGVIEFAGIWKKRGQVYGTPAYYVFRMFAESPSDRVLPATVTSGEYGVHHGVTRLPEVPDVPYLDVTATTSRDENHITLFVVNRSLDRDIATDITLPGAHISQIGQAAVLESPDLYGRNDEEHPTAITPKENSFTAGEKFAHTFPHASVTRLSLPLTR